MVPRARVEGGSGLAATGPVLGLAVASALAAGGFREAGSLAGGYEEPLPGGSLVPAPSVIVLLIWMTWPHLRHFIRTERPATFSSEIWYLALQLGQRNFIQLSAESTRRFRGRRR